MSWRICPISARGRPKATLGNLKPPAFTQEYVGGRNANILEFDFSVAVGRTVVAEYRQHSVDGDARRVALDENHGLLAVGVTVGVGLARTPTT